MIDRLKGKSVLVTGAAGFIGSNLVDTLLSLGCRVVALDNFLTGKRSNIELFSGHNDFTFIEGDIRDISACRKAVAGVELVLHQAAVGSVPRSIKDPMLTAEVNITGFINMLFAAQEAGVKRFVYASSSSIYGDNPTLPKVEAFIGKPLSPYAATKLTNEIFAENFHNVYGIDTVGLRYFNVFGRWQDPEGAYAAVIPKFAMLMLKHESPVINGDGCYSRDFTYIDNVVQVNLLAATTTNPEALNKAYNVACGKIADLNKLFSSLRSELGRFDAEILNVEPIYGPNRAGDIPHSLADISQARELLGYDPKFDLADGLELTAEWYFKNLK